MKRWTQPNQQSSVGQANYREDSSSPEEERPLDKNFFSGVTSTDAMGFRVYKDQPELPGTYDAAANQQRKQAKPDAISVLWHELLSPLTVIKGYTTTLLQLNDAITEEQKEQYIRGIDSASNRVIRLLENLRDITRLEETDIVITRPIPLLDLIRQVVSEVQSQTTKHIIKILPYGHLPKVKADPEKLEQVLNNLLVNAIKYSPQGGDIEVEVRVARSERELRGMFEDAPPVKLPCLIVSIADNGIGIPEAELDQIFEKFYRVNSKLARATSGAGLGLYISRMIVEAHGGHIWAGNRLQGGSIFSFSLPLD
jgi:signal transduction histidine kinase